MDAWELSPNYKILKNYLCPVTMNLCEEPCSTKSMLNTIPHGEDGYSKATF